MTPAPDQDLECMLADLESDLVERKESIKGDAPTKAREAICAHANDLHAHAQPGVLLIGARDDGTPTALPITDERNPPARFHVDATDIRVTVMISPTTGAARNV